MKKIFIFIISFSLFFIFAKGTKAACTSVASNQTTCSGAQTVTCEQRLPTPGVINRWCCDDQISCDGVKGKVQEEIDGKIIDPPTAYVGTIAKISDLGEIFNKVVSYILGLAGIVFFVLLVVGGFKYITSGGDPKAAEAAKGTLTSAITGLVIILISYLVLALITKLTGVDVTNFKITLP